MPKQRTESDLRGPITRNILFLIGAAIFILWLASPLIALALAKLLPNEQAAVLGQMGDLFGTINALFSGLAFAGVIIAILLQREELSLQRQELRDTRAEMARTADAQEAAQQALNKTIWAQSFKVALDILDAPSVKTARKTVLSFREEIAHGRASSVVEESTRIVLDTFDAVGAMVEKDLLPLEYLIETRSVSIAKQWFVLEEIVRRARTDAGDPALGQGFEYLAAHSRVFLKEHNVPIW